MFTDLVGYTALSQQSESLALELLEEHRRILRLIFSKHNGMEIKTMGDAFLVEFASALEAANCGFEIQKVLHERNLSQTEELKRIRLRIGVHLGDVIHSTTDVYGDAVNIASRIEPLADEGGVCLTRQVYDHIHNNFNLPLTSLGQKTLKNVSGSVEVYKILFPWKEQAVRKQQAESTKMRIAVLPLDNFSPDPNDEFFADGMTEELIDRLAQVKAFRVIARTSVMGYKKQKDKKISEIAKELGVGTIVEGSVRKAGSRIRITAQLIDTASEEHLWSDRYDKELDDVFAVQTEIALKITNELAGKMIVSTPGSVSPSRDMSTLHPSQDTQNMDAYIDYLRGRRLFAEKGSVQSIKHALTFFEDAVRLDPGFARARVGIAEVVLWLGTEGAMPYLDANKIAHEELTRALELNDTLAEAHSTLSGLFLGEDKFAASEREARRAIELNPNLSDPYRWLAQIVAGNGKIDEAVRLLESALLVDPMDINVISFLGRVYFYAGREKEALAFWERTKALSPYRTSAHSMEYYLAIGNYAKASLMLQELERLRPESGWTEMYRGFLAARTGDVEGARHSIEKLEKRGASGELTAFFEGFIHYALGDMDEFVKCIEQSFELHGLPLLELMYSPLYEDARKDPRIIEILRKQSAERHQ